MYLIICLLAEIKGLYLVPQLRWTFPRPFKLLFCFSSVERAAQRGDANDSRIPSAATDRPKSMIIISPPLSFLELHSFLVLLTMCLGISKHHLWPFRPRLTIEAMEAAVNAALRMRSVQWMKSTHVVAESRRFSKDVVLLTVMLYPAIEGARPTNAQHSTVVFLLLATASL